MNKRCFEQMYTLCAGKTILQQPEWLQLMRCKKTLSLLWECIEVCVRNLVIIDLPTMTRNNLFPKPTRDGKYVVKAGSILEVFCRTKEGAQPSATVNWLSKDEQVSNGPLWLIEAVRTSQSGNYTCRAHTQFATESVTVFLLVTG